MSELNNITINSNENENIPEDKKVTHWSFWLLAIKSVHFILFLFIIFAPFSDSNEILFLHIVMIPFLYLHWLTNNNTCALTTAERFVQFKLNGKVNDDSCFTCGIIDPVYNITNSHKKYNALIYGGTFSLWLYSVHKFKKKYDAGEIKSIKHLAFPLFFDNK